MTSIPVNRLDAELIKLAYKNHQETEQRRMEAFMLVQQQLDRMAREAGADLSLYTFSLDSMQFEPIPVAVPVNKPEDRPEDRPNDEPGRPKVVDFHTQPTE